MVNPNSVLFHNIETVPLSKVIVWDEVEARKLNLDGIDELANSIKEEGLQNPPVVQKNKDGTFRLIAGQRRLEALRQIGAKNIPVLVVKKPYQDDDAKAVSIIENLHRKQMSTVEMANACDFLIKSMHSTKKASKALGITPQTLRRYIGFASVPPKLQELVPNILSKNEILRLYQLVPKVDRALEIANKIKKYSSPAKKRYFDALELDPNAEHATLRRMANHFNEKQNIRIKLSQDQARLFANMASDKSVEPNSLASQIISKWILKHQ